ncbi:MAG: DMT family transporter [Pseudomonadota bacterium]
MSKPKPALVGVMFALLAFAIFSTHDVIVKVLGAEFSVFQTLFFAGLFSFIPVNIMMASDREVSNFIPRNPGLLLLRSLASVVSMSAAFYAFSVLPLAEVYSLIFATPLLITLLAIPVLGETIRFRRGIAVLVGLIGVVIVLRPGATDSTLGHGAALLAAFGGALASILVRKLGRSERTAVLILYPMMVGFITMSALQPFVFKAIDLASLLLMALVGFMALAAQMCIIAAYRNAPASIVAPMQYSQMIWAIIFGALVFSEYPDMWVMIGSAIIIASGIYIVVREATSNVSETTPLLRNPSVRPDAGPTPKPKIHRELNPQDNVVPDMPDNR